jgi:predicted 3-demethylubiquinone-9 3-methyltransferase (glyoxalase superfamily)
MINDPEMEKSQRVMQAILQMKKIDVEKLKRAYAGSV